MEGSRYEGFSSTSYGNSTIIIIISLYLAVYIVVVSGSVDEVVVVSGCVDGIVLGPVRGGYSH